MRSDIIEGFIPHKNLNCKGYKIVKHETYSYDCCDTAWHREWMTPDGTIAVGLLDNGEVDEVLFHGNVDCHLESMSDQVIWMMLNNRYVFHFTYQKGRRICLQYSYDDKG